MMKFIPTLVLSFVCLFVDGFMAPQVQSTHPIGFLPTAPAFFHQTKRLDTVSLFMADGEEGKPEESTTAKVSADGTYYDDEIEPTKVTQGISNSMKERLAREASSGLDPDAKQTNVLLYVIGAVAILVILGGQGIFY